MVPVSLSSIHPVRNKVNNCKWNKSHAPLNSDLIYKQIDLCEQVGKCDVNVKLGRHFKWYQH